MNGDRIRLAPDTRKRRLSAGQLREDAEAEYLESFRPSVREWHDRNGRAREVDGVVLRHPDSYRDERRTFGGFAEL